MEINCFSNGIVFFPWDALKTVFVLTRIIYIYRSLTTSQKKTDLDSGIKDQKLKNNFIELFQYTLF